MTDEKKTETAKEAATVKKAMISQPMAGKTDEEIVATRDLAVAKLRPVGAVVRDDGVRFESAGAAALATYGYCGSSNIVRAVRTGCKAGGHYWKRADEEDK